MDDVPRISAEVLAQAAFDFKQPYMTGQYFKWLMKHLIETGLQCDDLVPGVNAEKFAEFTIRFGDKLIGQHKLLSNKQFKHIIREIIIRDVPDLAEYIDKAE